MHIFTAAQFVMMEWGVQSEDVGGSHPPRLCACRPCTVLGVRWQRAHTAVATVWLLLVAVVSIYGFTIPGSSGGAFIASIIFTVVFGACGAWLTLCFVFVFVCGVSHWWRATRMVAAAPPLLPLSGCRADGTDHTNKERIGARAPSTDGAA